MPGATANCVSQGATLAKGCVRFRQAEHNVLLHRGGCRQRVRMQAAVAMGSQWDVQLVRTVFQGLNTAVSGINALRAGYDRSVARACASDRLEDRKQYLEQVIAVARHVIQARKDDCSTTLADELHRRLQPVFKVVEDAEASCPPALSGSPCFRASGLLHNQLWPPTLSCALQELLAKGGQLEDLLDKDEAMWRKCVQLGMPAPNRRAEERLEAAIKAVEGVPKFAKDVFESVAKAAPSSGPRYVPGDPTAAAQLLVPSVAASAAFKEVLALWGQHKLLIVTGTPGSVRQRTCRHTVLFLPRSASVQQACIPARTLFGWSTATRALSLQRSEVQAAVMRVRRRCSCARSRMLEPRFGVSVVPQVRRE
jgi:hypothetical protein